MTHDKSSTKFWYHGEYELLDIKTMQNKLEQHKVHCPYKEPTHEIKAWTKNVARSVKRSMRHARGCVLVVIKHFN